MRITELKAIQLTAEKQPCFDIYLTFVGVKKRARKEEGHSVKVMERVDVASISDDQGATITPEAFATIKFMALKAREDYAKSWRKDFTIKLNYIRVSKEGGFISTEFEPFGNNQHRIKIVEGEV